MSDLRTPVLPVTAPTGSWARPLVRWAVSFTGYPLGGLLALLVTGPVDGPGAALGGALLTGAVLGAVQAWALGPARPSVAAWIVATSGGLMIGLTLGSWLVDYRTDLGALATQGVVSGAWVGAAQAAVLMPRLGWISLAWPVVLGGIWCLGWSVTTAAGIGVDEQFTVFGSSGALVATLLTAVLPLVLNRHSGTRAS